jgi:hypothetical protein
MKFAVQLILAVTLAVASFAQIARTDHLVTQPLAVMPNWGGANGCGTIWADPRFNGLKTIRLTCATTLPWHGSLETGSTTLDSRHVIASTTGGGSVILGFDPVTEKPSPTPLSFNYEVHPSEMDASVFYVLHHTQIQQLTVNATWTAVISHVVLFDFASVGCLGPTFKSTWEGVFTVVGNPPVFKTAFSDTGVQGSGRYVASWSAANGCSVWNTIAGTVTKNGVLLGMVTVPGRFYLHGAGGSRNPEWSIATPTQKQPNGKVGCLTVGGCGTLYFWQIDTTNVQVCGPPGNKPPFCGGHVAMLKSGVLSGFNYAEHSYPNPALPLTSMGSVPFGSGDSHQSDANGADLNGPPLFIFTQIKPAPTTFPVWGTDEIMVLALDGSKKVSRLGQNGNKGNSKYFTCQQGIGQGFQQGHFALFTSDQGGKGALGYEADGITSRCDLFAIEAKY